MSADLAGTPLPGHEPRTYGLGVRWAAWAAILWTAVLAAIEARAHFLVYGGLLCGAWTVFIATSRAGRVARSLRRCGPPWEARGLWRPSGDVVLCTSRPTDAPAPRDWRLVNVVAGATALFVVLATAPSWWVAAACAAYLVVRRVLRPRPDVAVQVTYGAFPVWTGGPARFVVRVAGAEPTSLVFLLRCVAETPRVAGLVWPRAVCLVALPGAATPTADGAEVVFDLPRDAPPTDLLARPAVYWELVVEGRTAERRFEGAVQAPVYAPPVSGSNQVRRASGALPGGTP